MSRSTATPARTTSSAICSPPPAKHRDDRGRLDGAAAERLDAPAQLAVPRAGKMLPAVERRCRRRRPDRAALHRPGAGLVGGDRRRRRALPAVAARATRRWSRRMSRANPKVLVARSRGSPTPALQRRALPDPDAPWTPPGAISAAEVRLRPRECRAACSARPHANLRRRPHAARRPADPAGGAADRAGRRRRRRARR